MLEKQQLSQDNISGNDMHTYSSRSSRVGGAKFAKYAFGLLVGCLGVLLLTFSFAAPGPLKPQGTYTNWQWSTSTPQQLSSLDTYLSIESDPTLAHPGYGYYWASQFGMVADGGYMGIQTRGEAGAYRGKVAIFALFGTAVGTEVGSTGSWCTVQTSGFDGGQGSGSTCRIPLNWQAGDSYRLRLVAVSSDSTSRTWQASVLNQKTQQELVIGRIKTSLNYGMLKPWLSNWTEYYSAGRSICEMPYSRVTFGTPRFNTYYTPAAKQNNITSGGCVSSITNTSAGVRHEQGNRSAIAPSYNLPQGGVYISDLNWSSATTGYGVITKDRSVNNDGTPISLAGKTFSKGLGTHAISEIKYNLGGQYDRFVSYVNIQYGAGGTVGYQVWADGVKLFDSGTMDGLSYTQAINVSVAGRQELKLVATDAGDGINSDWAAWADARLFPVASQTLPPPDPEPLPPPAKSDSTSPTVTINTPTNGAQVGYYTPILASASDNIGVTKLEVYIDGINVKTVSQPSTRYDWLSYQASAGNHQILVRAYDAAGNVGQYMITVKK